MLGIHDLMENWFWKDFRRLLLFASLGQRSEIYAEKTRVQINLDCCYSTTILARIADLCTSDTWIFA